MSELAELIASPPTSAVRDTMGRGNEQVIKNPDKPASNTALREYCDKYYHQLLPIIAEKVHQEKVQEVSQHSESRLPNARGHQRGRRSGRSCSMSESPKRTSVFSRLRRDMSESPSHRPMGKEKRDRGVFNMLRSKEKSVRTLEKLLPEFPKSRSRKQKSSIEEDDLSQPWVWKDSNPFTPRIRYFDFLKKTRMPNNVKTYDESDDLEYHLKIFQAAAKVEQWAMPTWCHMFNSTLTGSARQKKCIKDLVEIHHIKQRERESTEDFMQRFKNESRHVKGASECMRISGFIHEITNPELIKRLHDNISKSVDEMMRVTTAFLRGEVALITMNQQRSEWRRDKFTLLTKSPREVLALDKGKFKTSPPMTTPVEKRNSSKVCEFLREVGHNTDECMHLGRQIEELIKAGNMSHVIKELKIATKMIIQKQQIGERDKPLAILMVQP
nr:hypothetical protein [Tanacetum cinerariifolium]